MKRAAVVSYLWERHLGALDEFLTRHGPVAVLVPAVLAYPRLHAITAAHGCEVVVLETLLPPDYDPAAASAPVLASLRAHLDTADWPPVDVDAAGRDALRRIVADRIEADVPPAVQTIDGLSAAHAAFEIVLFVTTEDVTNAGRVSATWAADHGIPSLHLAHSIALTDPSTVHAHLVTDVLAVYGERGAEGYVDLGIDPARIVATGNPAWDGYAQRRGTRTQVRAELVERYGLDPALPIVVFGTTWSARLSAADTGTSHADTLLAFVAACEDLRAAGVPVNAVVKDRPSNEQFGTQALERALAGAGSRRQRYVYATGDTETFAVAADVLVAIDSNYLVEAMLVGTPVVNLVGWSAVPMAPAFDEASGVVEAEPDQLAARLRELIEDPAIRQARLAQAATRVGHYNVGGADGQAASRVGRLMAQMAQAGAGTQQRRGSAVARLWQRLRRR